MITPQERQEVESTIKDLIRKSVSSKLTETEVKERGTLRNDVIDSFLTDIIALGYNKNSIVLAAEDILELQSQMPWANANKFDISKRVSQTLIKFKIETDSFILMNQSIDNGYDKPTIIDSVKKMLE